MNDPIEVSGIVTKVYGNNMYQVEVGNEENGNREILCHLSGKMKRFRINILPGDEVTLAVPPPYDKGRIIFRGKKLDRAERSGKRPKGRGARRRR